MRTGITFLVSCALKDRSLQYGLSPTTRWCPWLIMSTCDECINDEFLCLLYVSPHQRALACFDDRCQRLSEDGGNERVATRTRAGRYGNMLKIAGKFKFSSRLSDDAFKLGQWRGYIEGGEQ